VVSKRTFNSLSCAQKNRFKGRSAWIKLGEAGCSTAEISVFAGYSIRTVQRWCKRIDNEPVFLDRPRSGRPPVFTELMQLKITAFFCQMDPLPGCHSLTLKWAAFYFNQHLSFLGRTISASSVGRILRRHSLKPHLHKYFLQITDPGFFSILPILVDLYLNPPEYLFSFDECPGIQALKKTAPPLPPGQGKSGGRYSEPNHARMGTLDLFAFLDIKTGTVFGECTENHRAETLICVFKRHVASLPEDAVIHYICDNLSPHSCHEFCKVVAELCSVEYPKKKLKTK
jgi:transposase